MMDRAEDLKTAILAALNKETPSKVTDEILAIPGMSGAQYKHFANRLLSNPCIKNYLEIGVWKGSTAIAALYGNHTRLNYTVVDNFCEFGGPRQDFIDNWRKFIGDEPHLLDEDCFAIDLKARGIADVDAYFYDAEHEETNQYRALQYYYQAMANPFIYIVDDWSWAKVQAGTYRAMSDFSLKTLFKAEFFGSNDSAGWWNGCGIFILER